MGRLLLIVIFLSSFVISTSCIHVPQDLHQPLKLGSLESSTFQETNAKNVKIRSLIYRPEKYPLDDFFSQIKKGDLIKAFAKFNLRYQKPNMESEMLKELEQEGFISAYIEITNKSLAPLAFDEKSFFVADGEKRIPALSVASLPDQFKRFDGAAVAANVVNGMGYVVAVVGVAMLLSLSCQHGCNGLTVWSGDGTHSSGSQKKVFNKTEKTIHVQYQDYLISRTTLQPGDSRSGLLFFHLSDLKDLESMHLEALIQGGNSDQ